MKKHMGIAAVLVSAFLFGTTPVLCKITYAQGSNPVMLTFLRAIFAVPILFAILRIRKIPLQLTGREQQDILLVGFLGQAPTGILMYSAYSYIPVGLAQVLHFLYPTLVALISIVFFKSKLNAYKTISLSLGFIGVLLFLEAGNLVAMRGISLALASAFTYAIYMVGVERTSLAKMHYFKLSFYLSICSACLSGVFALLTGKLTFALTPTAWFYSFVIAILVGIGAFTLMQVGVVLCGATTASILSTLEPITGVVVGYLVLHETLTLVKLIGCVIILAAVLLTSIAEAQSKPAVPPGQAESTT